MERFKSMRGPVRLANTKGNILYVGEEFTVVPDDLVPQAYAEQLIPESLVKGHTEEIKVEQPKPEAPSDERAEAILKALATLRDMKASGQEKTKGGIQLEWRGTPKVAAVSELAGFKVGVAEIEEALGK